jgi:hypothetical protein
VNENSIPFLHTRFYLNETQRFRKKKVESNAEVRRRSMITKLTSKKEGLNRTRGVIEIV